MGGRKPCPASLRATRARYLCAANTSVAGPPPNPVTPEFKDTLARRVFSSELFGIPTQMFWGVGFVIFAALLFNRHRFGAQIRIVGDNPDSARQMAIDVNWVRVKAFVFMGLGASLAAVFSP